MRDPWMCNEGKQCIIYIIGNSRATTTKPWNWQRIFTTPDDLHLWQSAVSVVNVKLHPPVPPSIKTKASLFKFIPFSIPVHTTATHGKTFQLPDGPPLFEDIPLSGPMCCKSCQCSDWASKWLKEDPWNELIAKAGSWKIVTSFLEIILPSHSHHTHSEKLFPTQKLNRLPSYKRSNNTTIALPQLQKMKVEWKRKTKRQVAQFTA